jgi:F-type H+-transporting ATPase subunit c
LKIPLDARWERLNALRSDIEPMELACSCDRGGKIHNGRRCSRMTRKTTVFVLTFVISMFVFSSVALAADGLDNEVKKYVAFACGMGIAIAAFGGALGQGRAASAALEGIARNPGAYNRLFTPLILSLALIESLVIYSLVISFMLLGKL